MAKILKIDLDPTNKRLASSYKDNGILQRQVLHMAIAGIVEDSNYIEVVLQNCPVISDKAIGDPTSGRLVYIKQSHLWRLTWEYETETELGTKDLAVTVLEENLKWTDEWPDILKQPDRK